jgi:predicted dehydrogenase
VREFRELVASGAIGDIRLIESEHAAGGPDMVREPEDSSMRHWRFRESSMGKASVLGEVGSHPHNLSEYVSGQYKCGVIGRIWSSYVAAGSEHGPRSADLR